MREECEELAYYLKVKVTSDLPLVDDGNQYGYEYGAYLSFGYIR